MWYTIRGELKLLIKYVTDCFKGCIYGQVIDDVLGQGTEFMTDEDIAWKYPHPKLTLKSEWRMP